DSSGGTSPQNPQASQTMRLAPTLIIASRYVPLLPARYMCAVAFAEHLGHLMLYLVLFMPASHLSHLAPIVLNIKQKSHHEIGCRRWFDDFVAENHKSISSTREMCRQATHCPAAMKLQK